MLHLVGFSLLEQLHISSFTGHIHHHRKIFYLQYHFPLTIISLFIVRTQHASVVAVGVTSKFIVRAQHTSDVAVGVTSTFIVRAQHVSNAAVGVTCLL